MDVNVQHEKDKKRFVVMVDGTECVLEYRFVRDDCLEYYRTYVPEELRHEGIASTMADCALTYAKENNFKVIPTCSFVKDFIDKHEQYREILEKKNA